jgi:hypothetical protein
VSVARYAYDGVEVLDGKIYFVGGSMVQPRILLKGMIPQTNMGNNCFLISSLG